MAVYIGTSGNDNLVGDLASDTFYGSAGDDTIDGGPATAMAGVVAQSDMLSYENIGAAVTIDLRITTPQNTLGAGVDTLSNITQLTGTSFNDVLIGKAESSLPGTIIYGGLGDDTIYGILNSVYGSNKLYGGEGNDTIYADEPSNATVTTYDNYSELYGEQGDDILYGSHDSDLLDGGNGNDIAVFNINTSGITELRNQRSGTTQVNSSDGNDVVKDIETLRFLDGDFTLAQLFALRAPNFTVLQNNNAATVTPSVYSGPVAYLDYELIGSNQADVMIGASSNDFINLDDGDDAADGGDGDDVLDGGTGSNFLTGGNGADTFFLDGRSGEVTWSTIVDFNKNQDMVNIWGWVDGQSRLITTEEASGADGFTGATLHYDLNNDGTIDTSITFTGLSTEDLPVPSAQMVENNGYLLIA